MTLLDEREDSGHGGRGERGAAAAQVNRIVRRRARGAALFLVRQAFHQKTSPDAVAGEQRNVRLVAQAILGHAGHEILIKRLRITLASAAHDARDRGRAGKAGARSTAAADVDEKILLAVLRIAEALGAE